MTGPKTWKCWTTADDRRLRRLLDEGLTRVEVAVALDRSIDAVHCRIRQLGLARRRRRVA